MLNSIPTDSKKMVFATLAGAESNATWERAAQDVCNVFSHPEHQAREDHVETLMVMMSCSAKSRSDYSEAVDEARSRGLLKRPQGSERRLEGGLRARAC